MLVALALIGLGNLAGWEAGPLRTLVHFPVYWAPTALLLALALVLARSWKWVLFGLVVAAGFAMQAGVMWWKPAAPPAAQNGRSAMTFTVLSFNVYENNPRHEDVLTALKREQADVVYLTEMTPAWFAALEPLKADYPFQVGMPTHKDWLLSRHPIEQPGIVALSLEAALAANARDGQPIPEEHHERWNPDELLVATVLCQGRHIRVAGIHPPTPRQARSVIQQRACAALYAETLKADAGADTRLLVGDFNTSCFSPTFRLILRSTGLRNTAQGFGCQPTWGPRLPKQPWLPWVGIPIDHVLASENVTVLEHEVGPDLGSDHRWVKVRLSVP